MICVCAPLSAQEYAILVVDKHNFIAQLLSWKMFRSRNFDTYHNQIVPWIIGVGKKLGAKIVA